MPVLTERAATPPRQEMTVSTRTPSAMMAARTIPDGQPTTTEAPAHEVAPPKADPMAERFAELARREKYARRVAIEREQQLKAKEAEWQAKIAEYQSGYVPKARIKEDLLGVMSEVGVSNDDYVRQTLNQPDEKVDPLFRSMEQKIKLLEERLAAAETTQKQEKTQEYTQAVEQLRMDVKQTVSVDPSFELIKATGSEDAVVKLIEKNFEAGKGLMSVAEAAQAIEDYLLEEGAKIAALNKVKAKLAPPAAVAEKTSPVQKPALTTLTNRINASTPGLSARERAILAFQGKLPT